MGTQLVMGNEAFAYAALAAGVKVVAGYPGTPSSEVIETIARERAKGRATGVHVEWSTNEKVALELLAGASLGGARCLFTCKQVGLNVASDALLSLNYVGVKGGLVLFVADDPGPISSQTEQDTRRFAAFAKVPVLDPSTVEEGYDMMQAAFELSEAYQTPVIVRSSTRICHASTFLPVPDKTVADEATGFERSSRWVIFPRRAYEGHGEINARLAAIAGDYGAEPYGAFNPVVEAGAPADGRYKGIVAGGVSASYVREALSMVQSRAEAAGIPVPPYRVLQVGTPYPFPLGIGEKFIEGVDEVLVCEELDHVLEDDFNRLAGTCGVALQVKGKLTGHTLDRGENTVDDLYQRILDYLGLEDIDSARSGGDEAIGADKLASHAEQGQANEATLTVPELPVRPPVLCAGCPHRGSFYAIKQALKQTRQEVIFCGDIGCYTLGNAQPLDAVDTCLCMGAGITMAQGLSIVEPDKRQIAFVGDSTFFASGLPGIVNAVYNDHPITVVVLDNSITAMTGAQPHPGTGDTLMGDQRPGISIEGVLRAVGFTHIERANPFDLAESTEAARRALAVDAPSALIYEGPCITLVKPETPAHVEVATCTGCKVCIKQIGCPAIGYDAAIRKAYVNETLCTGCGLCVAVCPFDAIATQEEIHA